MRAKDLAFIVAASLLLALAPIVAVAGYLHLGPWERLSDMPLHREGFAAAAVGEAIYVIGGFNDTSLEDTQTVLVYNTTTDTWSLAAALPSPGRSEFGAASNGTHIFVVGGRVFLGARVLNILDVYDPSTDSWTRLSSMPVALATEYVVTYYKGKIYVTGGRTGAGPGDSPVRYFLIYDVASDTWSFGPDLPFNVSDAATIAFPLLEKIYVFGGFDASGNVLNTVLIYDISSNTWTLGPPMPEPKADAAVGICLGKILVIGGWNGTSTTRTVLVFDPYENSWSYGPPLPEPKAEAQGVTATLPSGGTSIHVMGGGMFGIPASASHFSINCPLIGGRALLTGGGTTPLPVVNLVMTVLICITCCITLKVLSE